MKAFSLRARLAFWSGCLSVIVLVLFGAGSAWNLYNEQLEAFQKEEPDLAHTTFNHRREAFGIVEDLMFSYVAVLPFAVAAAAGGAWWIAGRALSPIGKITRAAAQINAAALFHRLPKSPTQDEVGELVEVLNAMFDRLEQSFAQASRFSADASHELNTPLAILRGEIESALKTGDVGPEHQAILESLLDQTIRLSGMTSRLLLLARADAGRLHGGSEIVLLTALLAKLVEDAEILSVPKGISLRAKLQPDVRTRGDEDLLHQALLNLLDNAIKYNRPAGAVKVILRTDGTQILIEIKNTGPGIPPEVAPRIFERFFRVDPVRTQKTGGAGLGLSIAREIAAVHQGSLYLDQSDPSWTSFKMVLVSDPTLLSTSTD